MNNSVQRRFELQLYLARENPEPIYDVSKCELTTVPQSCFYLCKVLRKRKLYLNNNQIQSLTSNGNNIEDLTVLTHLYLEFNNITQLPENIQAIQYLQVLNVSNNNLTSLPSSLGNILYLRELYVQNNGLKVLPLTIFTARSNIEIIDVTENSSFSSIPIEILKLSKLRKFECSTNYLNFPSQAICQKGLIEILRVLCKENSIRLNPKFIEQLSNHQEDHLEVVDSSILDYENSKQGRLAFLKSIESQYDQMINYQKLFANKALSDRMSFINKLAEEESNITNQITKMHRERENHKQQLINDVKAVEKDAENLIEEIMSISKTCQKRDKILDEIENETMKKYQLYQISKNEFEQLRRQEILNAMSQMLISQELTKTILHGQHCLRENLKQNLSMSCSKNDATLQEIINERRIKQNKLLSKIENEENEQKLAFQHLQLQKDIRTLRLIEHISCVQSELILLSQAEQKKRLEQEDFKFNILNDRRKQLVDMLEILMQQKVCREQELQQRMLEIEEQRQHNQQDFWLIQYQRCLDMKPHCLWNENNALEPRVNELLKHVNATEYLPFFIRHKVTWDEIKKFKENNWKELGIHNKILINKLSHSVKEMKKKQEKKLLDKSESKDLSAFEKCRTTSTDSSVIMASHRETECCICLSEETTILFLKCGHICCCEKCSKDLKECPLCRRDISRFIKLLNL